MRSSRGFLRERSSRKDCSWEHCVYTGFLQHILMMHVNDSLQQLFALTCSYCDPKTLLIFHFLYVFSLTGLSVPLLWSSVFRLLPERKFHYITGVWFQLFGDLVLLVNGFSVWLFGKEVHLNTGLVCEF